MKAIILIFSILLLPFNSALGQISIISISQDKDCLNNDDLGAIAVDAIIVQ